MKIGITGASGFIGRHVIGLAGERGHECVAFSRNPDRKVPGCVETRLFSAGGDMDVEGCDALIHLAGESVIGIWTAAKRRRIRASRVEGTRAVVEAIRRSANRPRVLVSGSATGFYGDTGERIADENSPAGTGFLAETCVAWEKEAAEVQALGVRLVAIRTGMVLGPDGGALPAMKPVFKLGLGGELGSGEQWMACIHVADEAALILHAVEGESVTGPLNGVLPGPVRNAEFTTTLADALGRPAIFRVPAPILRVALGGFSAELLDSSRVVPTRTLESGFQFRFPDIGAALEAVWNG